MVQLKKHIIHFTLAMLLAVLAIAHTSAQQKIQIEECETMEFSVVGITNLEESHYIWTFFTDSTANFAGEDGKLDPGLYFVDGDYTGQSVTVTSLAVGEYWLRIMVWDEITCTNNLEMFRLEVLEKELDFEMVADSVCIGDPTTVRIIFSGIGPYTVHYTIGDAVTPSTYNLNGDIVGPEITIPITDPLPVGETTFWVIKVEDDCKAYEFTVDERPGTGILIYPKPSQSQIYLKDD